MTIKKAKEFIADAKASGWSVELDESCKELGFVTHKLSRTYAEGRLYVWAYIWITFRKGSARNSRTSLGFRSLCDWQKNADTDARSARYAYDYMNKYFTRTV
jgi:hypothetical protein